MLNNKFSRYLIDNELFDEDTMEKAEKKMNEYGGTSSGH